MADDNYVVVVLFFMFFFCSNLAIFVKKNQLKEFIFYFIFAFFSLFSYILL